MKRSKTPVIVIGIGLVLLILLPIVILLVPERGSGGSSGLAPITEAPTPSTPSGASSGETALEALAREARTLVSDRMADAATRKILPLDQLQRFQSELNRAEDALRRGREAQAKERFERIIRDGGALLAQLDAADTWTERSNAVKQRLAEAESLRELRASLYDDARRQFNAANARSASDPVAALEALDGVEASLDELEELASVRVESLITRARHALEQLELPPARDALEEALRWKPEDGEALALMDQLESLDGISDDIRAIQQHIEQGDFEAASKLLEDLTEAHPDNPVVTELTRQLDRLRTDQELEGLLAVADQAEQTGRLDEAIEALEAAIDIRAEEALLERLSGLIERRNVIQLEELLARAFERLRAAEYRAARDLYREALEIAPDSDEAKQGLERSARLLIAEIEFRENLESAHRFAGEGRFPMAATFFNRAMSTRPSNLPETERERELRAQLELQSERVPVTIRSDNRTFVSMIGVFPPEQFRTIQVELFPDVYRLRGTRRGESDVELELKVNAETGAAEISVVAGGR